MDGQVQTHKVNLRVIIKQKPYCLEDLDILINAWNEINESGMEIEIIKEKEL